MAPPSTPRVAPKPGARRPRALAQPSPWPQAPAREQQREAKRNAVLSTAAQMFNERGFHATSLDDIAARLQVSKPTLYYYVKNKDEILFECVQIGLQLLQDAIHEVGQSGGTAFDKLQAAMQQYVHIVTQDFGMCVIRVGEDPLPPESRRQLRRIKAALDQEIRHLITQGIDEGSIAPCDPKLAAFTLMGALSWIGRWYDPKGELSAQDIAQQCCGLILRGLQSPSLPR